MIIIINKMDLSQNNIIGQSSAAGGPSGETKITYLDCLCEFHTMNLRDQIKYISKDDWKNEDIPLGVPIKLEIHKHPLSE